MGVNGVQKQAMAVGDGAWDGDGEDKLAAEASGDGKGIVEERDEVAGRAGDALAVGTAVLVGGNHIVVAAEYQPVAAEHRP